MAAERLLAVASTHRRWALEQPHLFRLLYVAPVPGYDANAARLVDAATGSMEVILSLFDQAIAERAAQPGLSRAMAELHADAASCSARHGHDPEAVHHGVIAWTRLYGFIRLEIEGAFQSMGLDADSLGWRQSAGPAPPPLDHNHKGFGFRWWAVACGCRQRAWVAPLAEAGWSGPGGLR